MTQYSSDVAFSPAVKRAQVERGSREAYAKMERGRGFRDEITPDLLEFLAERDSLYLGTASADGQPYIQHRGGPAGFVRALDKKTLAFADFAGNRQYITLGNLSENNRAFIFFMDYPNRRRIKLWGRAEVIEGDSTLLARLADPDYRGKAQRAVVFHLDAWDINCPQHIQPRYTEEQMAPMLSSLRTRIAELEEHNQRLLNQLGTQS